MNATLLAVPGGKTLAQTSVTGPKDSLFVLIDRLTARLLALGAGASAGQLSALTTTNLDALRAYLDGVADFRRGVYQTATPLFSRAVELDSTFALALSALIEADGWHLATTDMDRVRGLAWQYRDRLNPQDQIFLSLRLGSRYPEADAVDGADRRRRARGAGDARERRCLVQPGRLPVPFRAPRRHPRARAAGAAGVRAGVPARLALRRAHPAHGGAHLGRGRYGRATRLDRAGSSRWTRRRRASPPPDGTCSRRPATRRGSPRSSKGLDTRPWQVPQCDPVLQHARQRHHRPPRCPVRCRPPPCRGEAGTRDRPPRTTPDISSTSAGPPKAAKWVDTLATLSQVQAGLLVAARGALDRWWIGRHDRHAMPRSA